MATLGLNELKAGVIFTMDNEPYVILQSNFVRMAQRKPVRQAKVKSLVSGKVLGMNFYFNSEYREADVERTKASFLFRTKDTCTFMDAATYEQFEIPAGDLGDQAQFLSDGLEVSIVKFEGRPISVELPKKVELKVTTTMDVARGDTAQGSVTKEAALETGATVRVPMFIKTGDVVRINTDTGEYVERA